MLKFNSKLCFAKLLQEWRKVNEKSAYKKNAERI